MRIRFAPKPAIPRPRFAYDYQTFSVGQVLTAAQVQSLMDSIRDHQHGVDGVSTNITLGSEVATTSGTSHTISGFPSGVRRITVMFNGVSLSGAQDMLVQLGDSGGVENTGYVSTGVQMDSAGGTSGASSTVGFIIRVSDAAALVSGAIVLTHMGSNLWVAHGSGKLLSTHVWVTGGNKTLSGELTQIRISQTNLDTFDAGTINTLYEL